MLSDCLDVLVQVADPMTDAAAVAFQLLLPGSPGTDTCAQSGEIPAALQPGQQVMQLRRLDLQAALLGASALGKDVEDQLGAFDDFDVELALEVSLLPR